MVRDLLVIVVWLVPTAFTLWGLVDASSYPPALWSQSGHRRAPWLALQLVCLLVAFAGMVPTALYLGAVRPKLRAAGG